jgi:hypothetical protein
MGRIYIMACPSAYFFCDQAGISREIEVIARKRCGREGGVLMSKRAGRGVKLGVQLRISDINGMQTCHFR